jgi:hypothetical protein
LAGKKKKYKKKYTIITQWVNASRRRWDWVTIELSQLNRL